MSKQTQETAEIAKQLERIADALETLGRVGLNVSTSIQDQTNSVCYTVGESIYQLTSATRANKPTTPRRKPTKRTK